MSKLTQFVTLRRVGDLKLLRRRRALDDAYNAEVAAQQACDIASSAVRDSEKQLAETETSFRGRPQCEQRQLLRQLSVEKLLSASAELAESEDVLADATNAVQQAQRALGREETRAGQVSALAGKERARCGEVVALREEEDRWTSPRAA